MRALIGLVAALALGATPTLAEDAASASAAAIPAPAVSPLYEMDHINIQIIGFAGDPVVLIPGLGTPRAVWGPFVLRLADRHRIIMVQVNGFGGDRPGGDVATTNLEANRRDGMMAGIVADLSRFLREQGIERPAVIGHSMGGLVGMMLARDHPDQVGRLMVVDALPFFATLMNPDATVDGIRPVAARLRATVAASTATAPSADDPSVAIMSNTPAGRLQVSTWSQAADRRVVGQALYEDMTTDLRGDVARIGRVPTTVLFAQPANMAERATQLYTQAYAAVPSIRVIGVPDSYHFIMLDQQERFRTEMNAFLAR